MPNLSQYKKTEWRQRCFDFERKAKNLWGADGKLRCCLMEAMGESGIESFDLRKAHLSNPKRFCGVEQNPRTMVRFKYAHGSRSAEDLPRMVQDDILRAAKGFGDRGDPPGILNLDLTTKGDNGQWWQDNKSILRDIARQSIRAWGCFVLHSNSTLDVPTTETNTAVQRLMALARSIEGVFAKEWGAGNLAERMLGRGCALARAVEDREFYGKYAGAFDIYRSDDHILRMATIRLRFHDGYIVIDKEVTL